MKTQGVIYINERTITKASSISMIGSRMTKLGSMLLTDVLVSLHQSLWFSVHTKLWKGRNEEEENVSGGEAGDVAVGSKYLQKNASDSEDSDDQRRVVIFVKDKRFEEMTLTVDQMKNDMNTNDWVSL